MLKFGDLISILVILAFFIPPLLFMWINCIDFIIEKIKEWF